MKIEVESYICAVWLIFVVFVCSSCTNKMSYQNNDLASESSKYPSKPQLRIPNGDEIEVNVEPIDSERILVAVVNKSSNDVFLPYLPGIGSNVAFDARLGLEKFNDRTENFEEFDGGHFGTGSNALKPGESFTYGLVISTNDIYRLNIRYIVDQELSERMNRLEKEPTFDDKWRQEASDIDEEIKVAVRTITTGPISLSE